MAREAFTITCSALPSSVRVAGFRGREAISRLYEFNVFVLLGSDGSDLDLAGVVGATAKLTLDRDDGRPAFVFNGIFAGLQLLHEFGERSLFRAVLVPRLWQLTQTLHSRVWTQKSIPDVIKDVLKRGGLAATDYDLQLSATYSPEEHVCQYRESDLDFIARWMEREGMYYFFEQGDDAEKLIITDAKSFQARLDPKPVRFFATAGHDGSSGEALHRFTCEHRALPASVKLRDYDYSKPTLDVSGSAAVSTSGSGEISVYGSRFFTPDDGKRLAKLRAQELLARQVIYRGAGTESLLRAGYFFELEDHPRPAFNMEYLAVATEHAGNQQMSTEMRDLTGIESDRVYWVEVMAIPSSQQFRAESTTAWPRVYGFENGVVCGPADSDYAQIDDDGRYNVRFKFDESDLADGKASTWVRMMQPHGGSPEGMHFPLRKATEVVFTFLGGDPDRPVIAGVVHNATNPSVVGKRNHTQNVIRTGANNQIVMEDQAGKEFIFMHTPNNSTGIYMGHPAGPQKSVYTGDGQTMMSFSSADNAEPGSGITLLSSAISLGKTTEGNYGLTVGGNSYTDITGNECVFVGGKAQRGVAGTMTLKIGGDSNEFYYAQRTTTISTGRTDTVKAGGMQQDIHGGFSQKIEPLGVSNVTGTWDHFVSTIATDHYGTWVSSIDQTWTATVGQAISVTSTSGNIAIAAPAGNVDVNGLGGHVNLQGSVSIGLTAPTVTVNGAVLQIKTPSWFDTYGKKGAAGIFKMDEAAIYQSSYGFKMDTTLVKIETKNLHAKKDLVGVKQHVAELVNGAVAIKQKAVDMWTGAFKKT